MMQVRDWEWYLIAASTGWLLGTLFGRNPTERLTDMAVMISVFGISRIMADFRKAKRFARELRERQEAQLRDFHSQVGKMQDQERA